ncbi:MAG: PDDEXK nuclease domain-containing protein [Cruoricaptor ignavus]|nr:PDDEXK nuclease domain-containing protein [Cruoricaptor ignavus]
MVSENNLQYRSWIIELKSKIRRSQIKAVVKVNSALIEMYWELGKEIAERDFENNYGSGFFLQLSKDLKKEFPEIKGFSVANLKYIKTFYLFYNQLHTNRQQLVGEFELKKIFLIPWGHHIQIFTKSKNLKEAFFYINKTIENGWSRAVLLNMLSANFYESQGKAITNFHKILPDYDSDLLQQTLKDPYNFDFLNISEAFKEKDLEDALINNIQKFLIELGNGFAFVGKQKEIIVSEKSYFIDLLFYHIKLKRYLVIELKAGSFEPEFVGKLNFYVSAIDHQLRDKSDNATIGLVICKDKDTVVVEYSLADISRPLGISSYELNKHILKEFKTNIPSIEEIENELKSLDI